MGSWRRQRGQRPALLRRDGFDGEPDGHDGRCEGDVRQRRSGQPAGLDPAVGYAALDTQLTTLAGNPVVFALEAGTADLVGKDGSTEVIRIHITGASLTNAAIGEVSYTYSTTLSQPIKHASLDGQSGDNSENTALLSDVTFEVTDKDTSTTQGTFNVTIVDDVPVQTAGTEAQTVYEDLLAGGNPAAGSLHCGCSPGAGGSFRDGGTSRSAPSLARWLWLVGGRGACRRVGRGAPGMGDPASGTCASSACVCCIACRQPHCCRRIPGHLARNFTRWKPVGLYRRKYRGSPHAGDSSSSALFMS